MMFRAQAPANMGPINGRHAPTVPGKDPTIGQYTLGVTISFSNGELMMKPLQNRKLSHSSGYFSYSVLDQGVSVLFNSSRRY